MYLIDLLFVENCCAMEDEKKIKGEHRLTVTKKGEHRPWTLVADQTDKIRNTNYAN